MRLQNTNPRCEVPDATLRNRSLRALVLIALVAHLSAGNASGREHTNPGYHADPAVTCIDGGPQAPERIVFGEPAIYATPTSGPYQIVGWLPVLFKATKGAGGPNDFSAYVIDSPLDASQIHWFVAGANGRVEGTPEELEFRVSEGARYTIAVLYVWLDPNYNVAGSDFQAAERHVNTAGYFPFPLPYCDFAAFSTIQIQ